ncbi:alpha/beta hydrolase [Kutzneria sp. CA-103260]|nr:alpha/beta hydrolase [Kutzneria sp. CA-103260]
MKRKVDFATEDGTILSGLLFTDDAGGGPSRGIVMAHGFSGVKEGLEQYATVFSEAGYTVLLYDHRTFGESGGGPRYEVQPFQQVLDWRDAITFLLTQPEVDSSLGVGVFGSSFAGGLGMVVAATDPRVDIVVAQIPNVSGVDNGTRLLGAEGVAEVKARSIVDRTRRLAGEMPDMIPLFSSDGELCAFPPHSVDEVRNDRASETTWVNTVTLRSLENYLDFEPAGWVPLISPKPLLMIVGEGDTCTYPDIQKAVFETAGEPKKLVTHPGGHWATYTTYFDIAGYAARDWFLEHTRP